MKTLSKSKYTLSCKCQKALWLKTYKPEVEVIDPSIEGRFAVGTEVGDLAKSLFGDYVETTSYTADGGLDIAAMIAKTQELVNSGCPVICEAAFAPKHHYCAVDILCKEGEGWAIYEVKSSTSHVGDDCTNSKFSKYANDIAYQRWVLEQCGIRVTGTYLVTINSDYVRHGDLVLKTTASANGLFNIIDLGPLVENEYLKVHNQSLLALQTLEQVSEPEMPLSMHCHEPYPCAFWKYCTQHLPQPSVFDVYGGNGRAGFTFAKQLDCYHAGKISFKDLAGESIGKIQNMQVNCTLNQTDHIHPTGIQDFLGKVRYPLYFLDFESMQPAVPMYEGTNPYMQICFQYSLHYIEHEGGELLHKAFLAPSDGNDPRRPLAEALCRDIPRGACIMVYNEKFEKPRIKEMAAIYPDLAAHLMDIHAHIIDLLIPFRAGHYYLPAMGGSFSIKSVLPALFPDDPSMDYHNLSTLVQNGGDAMTIFPKIQHMSPEEAAEARQALLDYCYLDTFALVKIWQELMTKV
jgi:hypothetical protein